MKYIVALWLLLLSGPCWGQDRSPPYPTATFIAPPVQGNCLKGGQGGYVLDAGAPCGGTPLPQGRLTLQSGSPVMTADQTAKSTIYYDDFTGQMVPIYNGLAVSLFPITGGEVSLTLTSGNNLNATVYDIFAVNKAGAIGLCTGPAWSSTTSRGTGAGTTQIHQSAVGYYTNQNSLVHCYNNGTDYGPLAADTATYLGSVYTTAAGQTGVALRPAAASGGSAPIIGLSNGYNRIRVAASVTDTTTSWTVASSTPAPFNGSSNWRLTFVDGLQQSPVDGYLTTQIQAGGDVDIGMVLDSTSATPRTPANANATYPQIADMDLWYPVLGLHFVQAMAYDRTGSVTMTFLNLVNDAQMIVWLWM